MAQAGINPSSSLYCKTFVTVVRIMLRTPGISAIAVLSWPSESERMPRSSSLVDRVILSILPVKQPGRLVLFDQVQSYLRYKEFRDRSQAFSDVAGTASLKGVVFNGE